MSQSSQPHKLTLLTSVAQIKAGKYSIGANNIPNASPEHFREFQSYWIDRVPVTFGHFERFVAGGGYEDSSLWLDCSECISIQSIDQRCDQLLEESIRAAGLFREKPLCSVDIPLVGLSWNEAAAIARFAGGRLAFESEWEVAMQRSSSISTSKDDRLHQADEIARCWHNAPRSDWGCVVASNILQEWTADAFSPMYWRADSERHGTVWTPAQAYGVSLRGSCNADMYKDYRFRRAANPSERHSARGFRRVWESEPSTSQFSSHFVLY